MSGLFRSWLLYQLLEYIPLLLISKALFLDGKGYGMVSEIVESIPGKFLSIHHLGEVKDGVEDPTTYQGEQWGDALENYTLKEVDGKTVWQVNMDMNGEYVQYMEDTWPLALAKVKELAEKRHSNNS